jgi:tetratricopeptide (TPR) repeat protein
MMPEELRPGDTNGLAGNQPAGNKDLTPPPAATVTSAGVGVRGLEPVPSGRRLRREILGWLAWGLLAISPAAAHWTWRSLTRPQPPALAELGLEPAVQAAASDLVRSINAAPQVPEAWARLGFLLTAHGSPRAAAECFRQCRLLQPAAAPWPYLEAHCREQFSPLAEVIPLYRLAATQDSVEARVPWLRLGEVLLETGQVAEARQCFQKVLQRAADDPRALLGEARAAWENDDPRAAREFLLRAQHADPARRAVAALLAQVEARLGNVAESERQAGLHRQLAERAWPDPWTAPIDQSPLGSTGLRTRAEAQQAQGDLEGAETTLRTALKLHPSVPDIRLELAAVRIARKQFEEGLTLLAEYERSRPDEPRIHFFRGRIQEGRGDYAAAADEYRQFCDRLPGLAEIDLARVLRRQGKTAAAEELLRGALRRNAGSFAAHRDLGLLLISLRRTAEGLQELQLAQDLRPGQTALSALIERLRRQEIPRDDEISLPGSDPTPRSIPPEGNTFPGRPSNSSP